MKQNRLVGALLGVVWLWLASGAWAQVTISNLVVAQRAGTKLVDISYDVSSAATNLTVGLSVSNAGGVVAATNLSGHVGNVAPGAGKSIVWNMGTDWNGDYAELTFMLNAKPPDYLIVDLSAGPTATNYPVSFLRDKPVGGWSDGYKSNNLVLRLIPSGAFMMGSPTNELGRETDETLHPVTLTKDYYIGVFELTFRQWERVRAGTFTAGRDLFPRSGVSYDGIRGTNAGSYWPANANVDSSSFMGIMRDRSGHNFDLPTESQWEYACRAGTTTALNSGMNLTNINNDPSVDVVGRYYWNKDSNVTAKVGSYLPNVMGLYDMHGNVWEWCLDWYGTYPGTVSDPLGMSSGTDRVRRGGYWNYTAGYCRSGNRDKSGPMNGGYMYGFRLVRTLP